MASSVVSAIIDKFGYLNIPIRDIGVHDYFLSQNKGMEFIKENYSQQFSAFSEVVATGGVSMLDRDFSKSQALLDKDKVSALLNVLNKKNYSKVSELYSDYKKAFSASIRYKNTNHIEGHHVELSVDFHKYDSKKLIASYRKEFGELVLIHMHREFGGWIESLASQRFVNPSLRKKLLFVFRWEYNRYMDYEHKIRGCEGLHLDCDSLFLPNTDQVISDIANVLGESPPKIVWEKEKYDLFGKLKSYHVTFTKADVEGKYLSPITLKLLRYFYKKKKVTRLSDIFIYPFYLVDLLMFSIKGKLRPALKQ